MAEVGEAAAAAGDTGRRVVAALNTKGSNMAKAKGIISQNKASKMSKGKANKAKVGIGFGAPRKGAKGGGGGGGGGGG